jgi:hypothetical protein
VNTFQRVRRRLNNLLIMFRDPEAIDLWLDDMRPAPWGWYHATTYEEAATIYWDYPNQIRYLALDHDLGQDKTGYDFVKLIVENVGYGCGYWGWPRERPYMLTSNPVGRDNMQQLIDRYGPYKKFRPI